MHLSSYSAYGVPLIHCTPRELNLLKVNNKSLYMLLSIAVVEKARDRYLSNNVSKSFAHVTKHQSIPISALYGISCWIYLEKSAIYIYIYTQKKRKKNNQNIL